VPSVTKLLVANRGEIARRVVRTARQMGIATVAVFSDADADAPVVAEADEAVRLPGSAPADTYLDVAALLGAARATGADAVHPGYGFLSENAAFARACADAGVVFVGPPAEVIESMGSKLAAKELMAVAGVPVLPGAAVAGPEDAGEAARRLGFPLLVKAAFGGGGRGMRVVRSAGDLVDAVASAQREAAGAFGDGTVFLERYVEAPRHVEVQIFGDAHGRVVHLFERECSIQRRYQKIIEEAPSPAVDGPLRDELGSAAVAAAGALGYVGAGTVEFVVDVDRRFYFLEVNTRLQVEHPVTEEITGLDLVRLQLLVARGEPIPTAALSCAITGHAVEARLYAEDVGAGFLPVSGTVERIAIPAGEGIRVDRGVEDGSVVSTHYDALLAKVIAWAPTRAEAANRLADALARTSVHGLTTNRDLLVGVLRHPEFLAGRTDTGFLTRHDPAELGAGRAGLEARRIHAVAAALSAQAGRRAAAAVQPRVPSGWRNVGDAWQAVTFAGPGDDIEVRYRFGRSGLAVRVDGLDLDEVELREGSRDGVDLSVAGLRRRAAVHRVGSTFYVDSPLGSSVLRQVDRFPLPGSGEAAGSLLAPMPGRVVRVLAAAGEQVAAGDTLVVLEAMKMEHAVRAPHGGTVGDVRVTPGEQVETGNVLVVVHGDADAR